MSWRATTWAADQKTGGSTTKLLLVLLAESADPSGVAFPGQEALAKAAECRRETVSVNLAKLEEAGFIRRVERRRGNGRRTSDWTILAPQWADRGPMHDADPEEHAEHICALARSCAESSREESSCEADRPGRVSQTGGLVEQVRENGQPQREGARASVLFDHPEEKPPKFRGRPVNPELWALARLVLEVYCEESGQHLGPTTASGDMSEAAKRIYSRVVLWPNLSPEAHRDIIRRTLVSKWWGDGKPSVGVVYGEKVFEENMQRDPTPARSRQADREQRTERRLATIAKLGGGR